MNQYTGWSAVIINNIPVVMLLFSIGFGAIALLTNKLIAQKKEIDDTAILSLIKEIQVLVKRIDDLVGKYDNHEERIDTLEKKQEIQKVRCAEREKSINQRFKDVCHKRRADPPKIDRSDRSD